PGAKLRFSMGHLSLKHFVPLRKSLIPSRRQRRQTASVYLAKLFSLLDDRFTGLASPFIPDKIRCQLSAFSKTEARVSLGTGYWILLYTLRRFGGRQPLCGIGVVSLIDRTSIPAEA